MTTAPEKLLETEEAQNQNNPNNQDNQNNQNVEQIFPIDPRAIKKVRHKLEKPLYVIFVVLHIGVFIGVFFLNLDLSFISEGWDNTTLFGFILIAPLIVIFMMHWYYAQTRAYAIRVSEKNFPEIYYKSVEFTKRLGLKRVPAIYVTQENGILNAFAAAIVGRKRYAQLNAELVDVAYMEHKDFDTVFFVLAHEFGHIYFKHVTFLYNLSTCISLLVPFIEGPLSRAREYSCDRVAQLLLQRNGVNEMMVLSAGRHLYKYVDAEDYLINAKKEKGLFLWVLNLLSTHPIMQKRIAALADPNKRSGKLF